MSHTTAFPYLGPPYPAPVRKVGAPLAVIIGLGTLAALILSLLTAVNPAGTLLGFALATAAMVLVLACYLWLDRWEPEPPRLLVLAFLWGSSGAVLISIVVEMLIDSSLPGRTAGAEATGSFVTVAVAAPIVEEAAKGLFLLLMMTGRRRAELNTLTDCLVYAGLTGAGFAWLENIVYIGNGEGVSSSLAVAGLRLILGPFAHPLFTTMFGIGVYFALQQRGLLAKVFFLLTGYAAAVLLHGLWNGSALMGAGTYLGVYVLWMMPIFALIVTLAVASRRRERHIIAAQLAPMVTHGLVTPVEAGWLGSLPARRQAVALAKRDGGRVAGTAVKRFVQAVVELAYARDRIDRGFGDARLFALQHDEVARMAAARMEAGPALYRLGGYRPPSG
ncbi:MAG TPA: PrsW family intramembrane metalloprotease [Mycobacterium sp.]|nr:PrsW family intramembrane metalloprotease [Mycobacterium sp.]HQE15757.1 PrsW family intramembrane metalloprotease [Mycobacterium sp.]